MTGFGASRREEEGVGMEVEVRSVNHRFLQVKSRLPQDLLALEPRLEARVRERLGRGSVTVRVKLAPGPRAALLDRERLRRYAAELAELARELDLAGGVDLGVLTGLPEALAPTGPADPERLWPGLSTCLDRALDLLDEMRLAEGRLLLADLEGRLDESAALLDRVEERVPPAVRAAREALASRVDELLADRDPLPREDLAREFALLADRLDISEEITRFRSHLAQWRKICAGGGPVGRRLDFLLQEMGREVNTMGAKANDAPISHLVVEIKAILEKQREQVQNLE